MRRGGVGQIGNPNDNPKAVLPVYTARGRPGNGWPVRGRGGRQTDAIAGGGFSWTVPFSAVPIHLARQARPSTETIRRGPPAGNRAEAPRREFFDTATP